jgi:hypothetical protein
MLAALDPDLINLTWRLDARKVNPSGAGRRIRQYVRQVDRTTEHAR